MSKVWIIEEIAALKAERQGKPAPPVIPDHVAIGDGQLTATFGPYVVVIYVVGVRLEDDTLNPGAMFSGPDPWGTVDPTELALAGVNESAHREELEGQHDRAVLWLDAQGYAPQPDALSDNGTMVTYWCPPIGG